MRNKVVQDLSNVLLCKFFFWLHISAHLECPQCAFRWWRCYFHLNLFNGFHFWCGLSKFTFAACWPGILADVTFAVDLSHSTHGLLLFLGVWTMAKGRFSFMNDRNMPLFKRPTFNIYIARRRAAWSPRRYPFNVILDKLVIVAALEQLTKHRRILDDLFFKLLIEHLFIYVEF